ncbi:hypothetical protein L6452_13015 [Arctium lappa]|uniref:Uncharacterized protein n=1 Tax=Arctium lappa TaxID=4217 RepID=A0ACB9CH44_ARCLA|nr:hypothetical protein L6452_13015 [Arctium lappa]
MQIQLLLLFLFSVFFIPPSSSQSTPQNIQVYFPIPTPPPPPPISPPAIATALSTSSNKTIAKAVAITAASSLVLSGLLFLLLLKFKHRPNENHTNLYADDGINNVNNNKGMQKNVQFAGFGGIDDEQLGLDVIYWKKLEEIASFEKEISRIKEDEKRTVTIDNGGRKSKFEFTGSRVWPVADYFESESQTVVHPPKVVGNQETMKSQLSLQSPPSSAAPAPPPPPPVAVERKNNAPPPLLPPKSGGLTSSSRPPPPLTPAKDNVSLSDDNQVKLKPLHWDKVNANVGHSMVWHKLQIGSFRVDDDLMETLFGTTAVDQKTPRKEASNSPSPKGQTKSRVFLLDIRKSQNIAIVLKSLPVSRSKIINCLLEGTRLDTDTLEKLIRISPSKEELPIILEFEEDITRLADAESFLYHILKAVPSAFTRFNIMLFKSNYRSEVSDLKNSLQTLEMACKELKTRGLFVKLLEAVLKAGNRMNVGTSRGNAQAFNLNSLLKLSDVKSSDGKSTLLHFVVEEVIRSEGKRCNISSNQSLSSSTFTEDYYIKLGLPVVGGVSSDFSNVKKAAKIDHDAFSKSCLGLSSHLAEITKTIEECDSHGGHFVTEMAKFLEGAEREIQVLREEEERIMGIVKKTNKYYQAGGSKDIGGKQFELFVIIRGFLEMVDKACVDIAIKLQKRRTGRGLPETGMKMPKSPDRSPVKFPVLPANFSSGSSSSDSDESS